MWDATSFMIGLGATTFAVAGLCFFVYDSSVTRERLRERVDLLLPSQEGVAQPAGSRRSAARNRLTASTLRGPQLELARRLERLNIRPELAPRLFLLLQVATAITLVAALVILGYRYFGVEDPPTAIGLLVLTGAFGWRLPHMLGDRLASQRRRAIARGLPDAIELLVIAVEAGLSLEDAINRITRELRAAQPAVAEELAATSADLRILPSRDDALRRLVERVDLPSMHAVVTTLSQTLKYGTPLAQALRVVAAELRNDALMRLEERTNRLSVLLTVPMILFILPSLFLIIMGPASLRIVDVFSRW